MGGRSHGRPLSDNRCQCGSCDVIFTENYCPAGTGMEGGGSHCVPPTMYYEGVPPPTHPERGVGVCVTRPHDGVSGGTSL